MHESILASGQYRYLKLAALAILASVVAYSLAPETGEPPGGTWVGYGLGGLCGSILLFLVWYGIRRRRYATSLVPLRVWLSAHIYLGVALLPIALLHSGGRLGWNFHGLFFIIVILAIATGLFGMIVYLRNPPLISANRAGTQLNNIITDIAAVDDDLRALAAKLPDEVNDQVRRVESETVISTRRGSAIAETSTAAARAMANIENMDVSMYSPTLQNATRSAISLLIRQDSLVKRARLEVQLKTQLKVWLFLHVPLSVAAVVGLFIHVFSVFYYW
jgi:hypothetical protein